MLRKLSTNHVFILLGLFWSMWLYTEVSEFTERSEFTENVETFIGHEDREHERWKNLCFRVQHLESEHHNLAGSACD